MQMTKKLIIVGAVILSIGILAFAYWTISPLFIDVEVREEMPTATEMTAETGSEIKILATGKFGGLEGHNASGTAKLIEIGGKKFVRFEEDFKITNGPDLLVYLGKGGKYDASAVLGKLKGNIGSQNYEIPTTLDLANYDSIWVWCRAFSVAFGAAEIK